MNVLVIPEDFRKDQYILQPVVAAMFTKLGKPAKVEILRDPLMGGLTQALNRDHLQAVLARYQWTVDLFLLCVDRDGEEGRRAALDALEIHFNRTLRAGKLLAAECAWQEIEVWALAGHDLPPGWNWQAIRAERDPKEKYFDQLAASRRLQSEPGGGRKTLGREAARQYRRLRSRCREDIQVLEQRIAHWLQRQVLLSCQDAFAQL